MLISGSLGNFAKFFRDPNPADSQLGGENLTSDGHITQGIQPDSSPTISNQSSTTSSSESQNTSSNQSIIYTWNQTWTNDLKRSIPINGSTSSETSSAANYSGSDSIDPILSNITQQHISDSDVDIAILDTGISFVQPDLNVYRNVTFVNGTLTGEDDQGHGSHVSGIAALRIMK